MHASETIEARHLEAASALWDYSAASAAWAFGQNSGNADADKIHRHLKREGRATKSDILREVFHCNKPKSEVNEALAYLRSCGLANFEGNGKAETWWAI